MKKPAFLLILFVTVLFVNKSFAQFNYIGGGVALATGGEYKYDGLSYFNNSFGIDLRASYDYSKKFKIVPDFKFYLPNKKTFVNNDESKTTVLAFNLNGHLILNPRTRATYRLYLLGGAHVSGWSIKDYHTGITTTDINEIKFAVGANLGAGMQFKISNRLQFFAEAKFTIAKFNQLVFSPGIIYNI